MKQLNIATESIAFQTGAFFKELTLCVQDLRDIEVAKEDDITRFCVRVDQCIYKNTGISTNVKFWKGGRNAFVLVPTLARGNVLNRMEFGKFLEKNFDANKVSFLNLEKKGWIDPATSRVGGAFSEVNFSLYLGEAFLFGKEFTIEEAAAVILHEVGHAYTFIQFIVDTVVVNSVLQRTYQELTNADADKKVKIILTKAADDLTMKNREWLESIENNTDNEIAFKVFVTAVQIEPRNMDNKRFFNMDAAEELADIFAARHGAGRAIITLRSKFQLQPPQSYGIMASIAWSLVGICLIPVAPAALVLTYFGIVFAIVGSVSAASANDITSLKHEAKKMRNQFVERIKLSNIPKEELVEIIESIELADSIIQNYTSNDVNQAVAVKFFNMFRRGKMDARSSREYTDQLESLAANNLFIRAAQLGNGAGRKKDNDGDHEFR